MNKVFFLKKTLRLLISLLLFSFVLYALLHLSTGNPALGFLRRQGGQVITTAAIKEAQVKLGLNGPFFQQYLHWLGNILRGNFGQSFMDGKPVLPMILGKAGVTLKLLGGTFVISFCLSLILGSLISNFSFLKGSKSLLSVILSFPIYWFAILIIFIFGIQLKWFPFVGSASNRHFVLPMLVICLSEGSYLTKMVSELLQSAVVSEHQKIAEFRGIRWYYRFSYQLNEAFVPLISLYGSSLTHLFGGTIMVEIIFSISGLGKLLMEAISTRDYPVIQGITLIIACSTFVLNYLIDLVIQKMDTRIQLNQGG